MANHLTELRKKAGFKTVKETSKLLGVSNGMLYQIEEGIKSPGIKLAVKIARLYKCSLEDIFSQPITTNSDNFELA
jgi:putative transcriptional regulator